MPPLWRVEDGQCTIDERGCARSPNYPENYGAYQECKIVLEAQTTKRPIYAMSFDTEYGYDVLRMDDLAFSGMTGPQGLIMNSTLHWYSDEDITEKGWRICPEEVVPLGFKPQEQEEAEDYSEDDEYEDISGWTQAMFFACDDRAFPQLVSKDWVCDGEEDCDNGADEVGCPTTPEEDDYADDDTSATTLPTTAEQAPPPEPVGSSTPAEDKDPSEELQSGMPSMMVAAIAVIGACGSFFAYSRGYCAACCGSKSDYGGSGGTSYGRSYRDLGDSL